jgi:tyrosine-protein kinase Etk/Wzc
MTDQTNPAHHEDNIDLRRFLIKTIANWPLFVISIGLAYAIAYLINRYTEPQYSVNASIMIKDDRKSMSEMLIPSLDRYFVRQNVENEMSILKSYSLTRRTLSDLDFIISYYCVGRVRNARLYKPFFNVELDSVLETAIYTPVYITVMDEDRYHLEINSQYKINRILRFGEPFRHPNFNFTIRINKDNYRISSELSRQTKISFIVNDLNSLTNQYMSRLNISTSEKKSTVVSLSISGPVPQQETDYLNKLCEVYIRTGLEDKNRAAINTIKFIDSQLGSITDSLRKAELKLQNFRLENQIVDISKEGDAIYTKIQKLQSDAAVAELQKRYCIYLKNYIERKSDYNDIIVPSIVGISESMLNSLVTELSDLYKQKAVLKFSAQEDNPAVSMINLKLQKAVSALKENVNEMINTADLNIKDIKERTDKQGSALQKLPVTERQLINIRRDFDLNNNIFTFLLQKRAEAGIAKASNIPDNKILDEARAENATQISPKRSKNYLTALFLGSLIPLIIIFMTEYFNTRLTDLKELERLKKCNIIGTIGHNDKMSDLPVFEFPKSALSESFRSLRTNLQYLLREKDEKIILITSTISGEGKTFCATNIATILAMSNKKVLLIGLDLRKPKIHKFFNISNDSGLSTYLINQSTKDEIVIPTNIKNLYLVPAGPIPPNPSELIETEAMEKLINEYKKEFDYIILDTPPIAIVTDAILASKFSNTSIFVIRHNFSSKDVLYLADELAERGTMKKINILINDVKLPGYYGYSFKYGYKYGYGYSYNYGYGNYKYGHEYYGDEKPKKFKDKIKKWLGA